MSKAIFLGSFNPPHIGHYNCIKSFIDSNLMETLGIDKIHIIPCYQNPNKNKTIDYIHRYKMCVEMFMDLIANELVSIDDIEDEMCPKYTYELIEHFKSNKDPYIKDDFWWIITEETYKELIDNKWKNSQWLLSNNQFIIIYENKNNELSESIRLNLSKLLWNEKSIIIPLNKSIDIHSTQLREYIKNGQSIEEYTNKNVQKYIEENNLYKY